VTHWKAKELHLSALLHTPNAPTGTARHYVQPQDKRLDGVLDWSLMEQAKAALRTASPVILKETITNEDRTACTMLSSQVTRNYGPEGFAQGHHPNPLRRHRRPELRGVPHARVGRDVARRGQRFLRQGHVRRTRHRVSPRTTRVTSPRTTSSSATWPLRCHGGTAFIHGIAGERFAVRNSGATAVVEGVGDHACEYMTGGTVVILGRTGRNFAAGMTGGVAYVVDVDGDFTKKVNREMVETEPMTEEDIQEVHGLLVKHLLYTTSTVAKRVLEKGPSLIGRFVKVMPKDYKRMVATIKKMHDAGMSGDQAIMAAFEENARDLARVGGN
jgi:glutamate synthase (NADPH/NADH) large chain